MSYYKHKKKAHTRDESERRDNVSAIRYSDAEGKKIKENAKEAGMSVNSYLVMMGVNRRNALAPALLVFLQNHTNFVCSLVELTAIDEVVTMQEGMNEIWQKLS